jgi:DHA1 family tetracycline resistance protein-like MFS transporter
MFIFVTVLLDIIGLGLLIPVAPRLIATFVGGDLAVAAQYTGPLMALYTLMQFLAAPLLGALSDRFGRKPLVLAALATTCVAYLIMANAPALGWFFLARGLSGLAAASLSVAAAYIADVSTDADRAKNFGLLGAAYGIGFIIGPALGGALATFGLTVPYWVAAAVAAANFAYGLLLVPESLPPERRVAFRTDRINPLSFMATLRGDRLVWGLAGTLLLVGLAQQFQQSTWVLFTAMQFGWSPAQTGGSLCLAGLCMALVQGGLLGKVLPVLGERRAMLVGLAWCMLTLGLLGLCTNGHAFLAVVALSAFSAIAGPATQSVLAKRMPASEQGALQGALTSLNSLAGILGPVPANMLFAAYGHRLPGVAFLAGALLLLIAFGLMLRALLQEDVQRDGGGHGERQPGHAEQLAAQQ